jgi:uncharacterized protein YbaA (DUF1428 family)
VSALLTLTFTFFAKKWIQEFASNLDEKTITPSDYTLFVRLDEQQNAVFNKYLYKHNSDVSRGEQMRDMVWQQMNALNIDDRLKVARIDLVFDNRRMI